MDIIIEKYVLVLCNKFISLTHPKGCYNYSSVRLGVLNLFNFIVKNHKIIA